MRREDIINRLAAIEKELKKRRADDRLGTYNKGSKKHKKQIAIHK